MPVLLSAILLLSGRAADFEATVRPAFARACVGCHGPAKQKSGLRLDRRPDAFDPADLLHRVTTDDADERMPPTGDRLTKQEVAAVRRWVEGGANWPVERLAPMHWSFRPVTRPSVPTGMNPIDHLIRQKLTATGLTPNPPADRRTLIRRLTFDLHGLPPTPDEVTAFEKDSSPDANEKLVDRLLASPRYGERWARHWLDVVRFAESNGFETNLARPTAWPYRDWVIRALNRDLPIDRFVFEQLAGDTVGVDAATGFLVAGPWDAVKSPDPVLTAQQRADELHDMVGTTAAAFLGLTVGCARCHAHKFDPVPQADYYRLAAVFAGVQHGERELTPADPEEASGRVGGGPGAGGGTGSEARRIRAAGRPGGADRPPAGDHGTDECGAVRPGDGPVRPAGGVRHDQPGAVHRRTRSLDRRSLATERGAGHRRGEGDLRR